ncbi:hypothetical protein [Piscirickettsia litoralis]|uniref:Uncharacterized protein n=1 Tax=Piscirickettsia litoralis TaxID=1891921 RepID=A0ABX2ZYC7_9GAMM|nr:hypothetical protein [Piscirickettsia litoralis]ODN41582.1 hypothetical protein BGC07_15880 [Piscirickettsia litoralis]
MLNDTLIDTLLSAVQSAVNAAEREQKEVYFKEREQRNQSFTILVDQLRQDVQGTLSEIRAVVADKQLTDSEKLTLIDTALNTESAKPTKLEQKVDQFKKNAAEIQQGPNYLAMLEARSLKLQHRVADIVRQVRFAPNCSSPALWEALCHYQSKDGNIDQNAPVKFFNK